MELTAAKAVPIDGCDDAIWTSEASGLFDDDDETFCVIFLMPLWHATEQYNFDFP